MISKDAIFKVVAHPIRREIIALLATSERSVKELTAAFDLTQPAISQHLRELRQANLVASQRVGLQKQYRLTAAPLKVVFEWSSQYRRFFDPSGHAWEFVPAKKKVPAKRNSQPHGR